MILHQSNPDKSLHPASLTKVMTLLMAFEAIEGGKLQLNDRIRISNHAASMVPSKLDLKPGSSIKVKDAIYVLVTKSANDVAVAMAEHLGGTESGFASLMNRKAIAMGMNRTTFRNASGLHDKRQVTTARDMAKMARYVINEYPEYYRYFSKQNYSYDGKSYRNHNRLMSTYKGMDGMKTGYVAASGFNLIASAVRNNRRVIGVVFGGRTSKTRNAHMEVLLDSAFSKIADIRVASANVPLPSRKPEIVAALGATITAEQGESTQQWSTANAALQGGYQTMIGEGDFDPAISRRIETGLMAIAAYKGESAPSPARVQNISLTTGQARVAKEPESVAPWSVQIGAFTSRVATDEAIQKTLAALPTPYSQAQPMIAPLKTADGWLFRGRLTGFTRGEALAACNYIDECLPVAPQN